MATSCVAILAATLVLPGALSSAAADGVPLTQTITSDSGSLATVEIAVPDGVEAPYSVLGTLRITRAAPGNLTLLVDGEPISSKPVERERQVNLPVPVTAVEDDRVIELGVRYDPPADLSPCERPPLGISLSAMRLLFAGSEAKAQTVAEFFPPQSPRVDVIVPPRADADVLAAGLTAVAAAASRYPDAVVGLRSSDDPPPQVGVGQRAVRVTASTGAVQTAISTIDGIQTLELDGRGEGLAGAARALASDRLDLVGTKVASGLTATTSTDDVGPSQSLDALGVRDLELSGYGPSSTTFQVRQDAFGGYVDTMALHLEGTHSELPEGVDARLDVYVNDFLVGSGRLGAGQATTLDADIAASSLASVNDVRLQLTVLPSDGDCTTLDTGLPFQLFIDAGASGFEATLADAPGVDLGVFPEVLQGRLAVALRGDEGPELVRRARQAAPIVAALQQAAARPLEISLVEPGALIAGTDSGVLVGADERDTIALNAPMRLNAERELQTRSGDFAVASDEAYATIQSVSLDDRHLVLLGGWAPTQSQGKLDNVLDRASYSVVQQGWDGLSGDVVVYAAGQEPVVLEAPPRPRAAAENALDESTSYVWWFVLGIAALLLLLALQAVAAVRRARAKDGAESSAPQGPRGPNGQRGDPAGEEPAGIRAGVGSGGEGDGTTRVASPIRRASTGGADRGQGRQTPRPRRRNVAGS